MPDHLPLESRMLLHLVTIADAGSISKAAHSLGLTQPALSKSIHNAENRLGTALFHRAASGIIPTPVGETVIKHARQALLAIAAIDTEVRSQTMGENSSVRIGCGPTVATQLIETILHEFVRENVHASLDIITGNPHDLAQLVEKGELDLMLGFSENLEGSDLLTQRPLRRDPLHFFASSSHPLSRRRSLAPIDLAPYRIALPFRTKKIDDWLDANAHASGTHQFRVSICNDMSALSALIKNSLAISIGPMPFIERLADPRGLIPLSVDGFHFDRLLHCVIPRRRPISKIVEKLTTLIELRMSNIAPAPRVQST